MSRTFRRKNSRPDYLYDEKHCNFNKKHPYTVYKFWQDSLVKFGSIEHIKKIREYHSDKMYVGCPASFKRNLNRELRTKNKQILKRIIKENEIENDAFIPYRKTAMWLYW